ncbi:MAG: excinuclease ABC subunit UvrB [Patescibacteria group bacterium]
MSTFTMKSEFAPAGDQPKAISSLLDGLAKKEQFQTLLGVTGSGKTFTVANVIEKIGKPTLVIAHNKTLAAQLAQEYRHFFPNHAVHYFVSYYDYYQPEAYMPNTDTYIEKDASINEEIERLRHASTQALLTRPDVIIVASVSCIYGLGSPAEYEKENLKLSRGQEISRAELGRAFVSIFHERTNADLKPGFFRVIGNALEIMPMGTQNVIRFELGPSGIERIATIDPISSSIIREEASVFIFPSKHFFTNKNKKDPALKSIGSELKKRLKELEKGGKILEAERLKRRTTYDLAMIREVGYCSGIENYSRHLAGREAGSSPDTLLSYFPHKKDGTPDFLTIIDESHATIPQIGAMFGGDQSRKKTLIEHGFRLPSALDNRPLKFSEFWDRVSQVIFTSATPADFEREKSSRIVEQIIRPTGLVDPIIDIKPVTAKGSYGGQVQDVMEEIAKVIKTGFRAIATTLTKKMAEDLAAYFKEKGIKSEYLHSEIKTLDRIKILTAFRRGDFDVLVGVNLLREGLDLPEVSFIGVLDADKEGFLRSETSLVQIIGRAARNDRGRVVLYADGMTNSLTRAVGETNRRREIQLAYNKKHGITPKTIQKKIEDITQELESEHDKAVASLLAVDRAGIATDPKKIVKIIKQKKRELTEVIKLLDFESAAILRDEIRALEKI